jgi:hypothetical protein
MGVCPQLIPDLPKQIPVNLTNDKAEELHNRQHVDEVGAGYHHLLERLSCFFLVFSFCLIPPCITKEQTS